MTDNTGNETSSLRIGTVTAVRGRRIEITVDVDKNDSSLIFQGQIISNVSIGSFLVVRRGYAHLVVQVEEEELIESNAWNNSAYQRDVDRNTRILKTILLGEFETDTSVSPFQTRFISGSQTSPLIGNIAYLASPEQASKIYVSNSKPETQITIGHLATNSSIPIYLDISTLFSGHIGIFGNAGSGKTYTLSQIYTQLFSILATQPKSHNKVERTRFLIFDLNGEYSNRQFTNAPSDNSSKAVYPSYTYNADPAKARLNLIPLHEEVLYSDKFWFDTLEASEQTQQAFITNVLNDTLRPQEAYDMAQRLIHEFFSQASPDTLPINILYSFLADLHNIANPRNYAFNEDFIHFKNSISFNHKTQHYAIKVSETITFSNQPAFKTFINDHLERLFPLKFTFILTKFEEIQLTFKIHYFLELMSESGDTTSIHQLMSRFDSVTQALRKWFRFHHETCHDGQLLQIINLQQASSYERQLIPLITVRAEYEQHKQKLIDTELPCYLNIAIEEAHSILSQNRYTSNDFSRNARLNTFEEIIKEGRKFGVFLTVVSQRPSEISPTITSQLHHYFLHRLVNPIDLDCIKNTLIFLDRKSYEFLPSLSCGTCIVSGTSLQLPAVVKIDELPEGRKPNNETIDLVKLWGLGADSAHEGSELI